MVKRMTPYQIRKCLKDAGCTQKEISDMHDVSQTAVSLVINHKSKSKRLMVTIASQIGKAPKEVWGDLPIFDDNEQPQAATA